MCPIGSGRLNDARVQFSNRILRKPYSKKLLRDVRGDMARNVEIKAHIDDLERTRRLAESAADRGPETLIQTDTFFKVEKGRLKLREFADGEAELILYSRPDATGPTESSYDRTPVLDVVGLRELLSRTLGVVGCVRKTRMVYWAGRTRIHLDVVQDLGNFLELEVVLKDQEHFDDGEREAGELMNRLGIGEEALVPDAYMDLLLRRQKSSGIPE